MDDFILQLARYIYISAGWLGCLLIITVPVGLVVGYFIMHAHTGAGKAVVGKTTEPPQYTPIPPNPADAEKYAQHADNPSLYDAG